MSRRKELEQELKEANKRVDELRELIPQLQRELRQIENRQQQIVEKLMPKSNGTIGVSDHALLRYLERKYNLNMAELKSEILTPDRAAAIKAGAKKISVDGIRFHIKGNTIVTTI